MSDIGLIDFQIMNYTDAIWFLYFLCTREQKLVPFSRAEMVSYNPFHSFPFLVSKPTLWVDFFCRV